MSDALPKSVVGALRHAIGLEPETIGSRAVLRAVERRAEELGLEDSAAYASHLHGSPTEVEELVEAVVVPESWFFRERSSIDAVVRLARERAGGGSTRVLCLPCAGGEEAYSIAMGMLEAGRPRTSFSIDAVDVSRRALDRARDGVYSAHAFRGGDLDFRDRWFVERRGGWELAADVRGCVDLRHGNALEARTFAWCGAYDAIFCRNLLIYMAPALQRRVLELAAGALRPGGLLVTAVAEHGAVLASLGEQVADVGTGVWKLRPNEETRPPLPAASESRGAPRATPKRERSAPEAPPVPGVQRARELADQGRSREALAICEALGSESSEDPAVQCLMGILSSEEGDAERAEEHFRRALYLDPDHREARVHLGLTLELGGRAEEAARVWRADRRRDDADQGDES